MANEKVPYVMATGNITKTLDRAKKASVPPRFTQDFLGTKLNLTGGSARPIIPFLKRTGFLGQDGAPTELYKRFRNDAQTGSAAAQALRTGYGPLYAINEYVHDTGDKELKGIIVQATGLEADSSTVAAIVGSFKALKAYATFDGEPETDESDEVDEDEDRDGPRSSVGIKLGYTINLNLPATSDVAVFDAIFKSLKQHLL